MPQSATSYAKQYAKTWTRFTQLGRTRDSLAEERDCLRCWMLLPYIAFLIPIDDAAVIEQLATWQRDFQPWLAYDAQPAEHLHITLHYVGMLRRRPWMLFPHTWRRDVLPKLAERVEDAIQCCAPFEIAVGPLNAFSTVLIAEVQDPDRCLQHLRARVRRALPLRARPPSSWAYLPHVTLGYWGKQNAKPLIAQLRPYREIRPQPIRIDRLKLTVYTRDRLPLKRDVLATAQEDVIAQMTLHG